MVLNHVNLGPKGVAICGGGLVGCLLAIYLRKHGFDVSIYESREDPRRQQVSAETTAISAALPFRGAGVHYQRRLLSLFKAKQ